MRQASTRRPSCDNGTPRTDFDVAGNVDTPSSSFSPPPPPPPPQPPGSRAGACAAISRFSRATKTLLAVCVRGGREQGGIASHVARVRARTSSHAYPALITCLMTHDEDVFAASAC